MAAPLRRRPAVALAVTAQGARATPAARRRMSRVVRQVSHALGSTPAVCHASSIDPKVFELFGSSPPCSPAWANTASGRPATRDVVEAAVLGLLGG